MKSYMAITTPQDAPEEAIVNGHCSNRDCSNADVGFEISEEEKFCSKCGCSLVADGEEKPPSVWLK
jgi:hypothetical protein